MELLAGKTAVIVGGHSGFGEAISRLLGGGVTTSRPPVMTSVRALMPANARRFAGLRSHGSSARTIASARSEIARGDALKAAGKLPAALERYQAAYGLVA